MCTTNDFDLPDDAVVHGASVLDDDDEEDDEEEVVEVPRKMEKSSDPTVQSMLRPSLIRFSNSLYTIVVYAFHAYHSHHSARRNLGR